MPDDVVIGGCVWVDWGENVYMVYTCMYMVYTCMYACICGCMMR